MKEKTLESYLRRQVKKAGGECIKWEAPGSPGVPDRVIIMPNNRIVFAEIKNPNGKGRLSARQRVMIKRLKSLGADVRVVSNKNQVEKIIAPD